MQLKNKKYSCLDSFLIYDFDVNTSTSYHKKDATSRPSWQEMFMNIAEIVSNRSKDPRTKVGAVLVKDNRILSIGYNGEPKNFNYQFDWHSKEKYKYVIHAEVNAIINACKNCQDISNSEIYLTLSPCSECMKLLVQFGICKIYYKDEYKDISLTKFIAKESNIELIKIEHQVN